jgi:hypothetical protein
LWFCSSSNRVLVENKIDESLKISFCDKNLAQ